VSASSKKSLKMGKTGQNLHDFNKVTVYDNVSDENVVKIISSEYFQGYGTIIP
jgi:hypothetical protein